MFGKKKNQDEIKTETKAKEQKPLPIWARIVIAAFAIVFLISFCSKPSKKSDTPTETPAAQEQVAESEPTPETEPAPEPEPAESAKPTFENDFAKAEFKGVQDVNPYFYVNFMVTNKLAQNVVISGSDVVVNESVNVRANGGSSMLEPIEPGNSGYASLSVAYEFAGVSGLNEVKSITGTLVLNDESLHEIATLPFSVTVQ